MTRKILLQRDLLENARREANLLRDRYQAANLVCLNLVSSPGSGKTSLLEQTLRFFSGKRRIGLIAGDVQTHNDADRLQAEGGTWVEAVETGGTCHLEATMISKVLQDRDLSEIELLFIENVGNLVCPAAYDLGEQAKVVVISTVEGDDKPLKYPTMFANASMVVINKADLLGLTDFNVARVKENALRVNPDLDFFTLSCRSGQGLQGWFAWLEELMASRSLI